MSCQRCHSWICKCPPPIIVENTELINQQAQRIAELEAEVARLSGELSLSNRTGDHLGMRVRDLKAEVASLRVDAERYRWLKVWLADPSDKFDGVIGSVRDVDELDAAIDAAIAKVKP